MEYMNQHGTGNSKVDLPQSVMTEMNNTPVTRKEVFWFLMAVEEKIGIKIDANLSERKTKKTWGSANIQKKKVNIYRHSVWVLLHELAHIISPPYKKKGKWVKHGPEFGQTLVDLYYLWIDNSWRKYKGE